MRVLVLSPLVPGPGASGFQIRVFHLLQRLVERGDEVVVCCPIPQAELDLAAATRAGGIAVHGPVRPASRVAETLSAIRRRPAIVGLGVTRPLIGWQLEILWQGMSEYVDAELARRPDVVLVEWDGAAAWHAHLPADVPAVLTAHDASWVYLASRAADAAWPRRALLKAEAWRTRRFARRWLPHYREVVCVSELDAERVRAAVPGVPATVVDNGVDLDGFAVSPDPGAAAVPTVLFTGTLNYAPNEEGATWLARAVWPSVLARVPGARLRIVGRNPPASVRSTADLPGVEVHADVPDVRPYLADAHVIAVPIHFGGGTRLKLLEAGAAGRAVVSTTIGAEGLALVPGRDLVIADGPEAFAEAVVGLLRAPQRRQELAAAARSAVEASYGWTALGDRLAAVLQRVAR